VCLERESLRKIRPRSGRGKSGARRARKKKAAPLRLGKKSGSEASRASVTGRIVEYLRRKASKTPRKERLRSERPV